jgi:glycosyltransferase involved in cell wall biosynthesis
MTLAASPSPTTRPRKWDVIHACDNARQVADLLDAQATANIRAYVLSRPRPAGDSLLQSWNEVRKWRTQLDGYCGEAPFDSAGMVVHAHSFTAGMAAIRGSLPAVYDVSLFIDQQSPDRSWLARSFRAAEQFVLAQADAVVVHSEHVKQSCASRGVDAERIFLVPQAAPLMPDQAAADAFRRRLAIGHEELVVFSEVMDSPLAAALLEHRDATGVPIRVLLSESASAAMALLPQADRLAQMSVSVSADNHPTAVSASDLILAVSEDVLLAAMTFGKPSLTADSAPMRSISPEGAGLVWHRPDDPPDRGRRFSYLLREKPFRESLGAAARRFITEKHSLQRIGKLYEDVYRFAVERKKPDGNNTPTGPLIPVAANL